MPGARPCRTVLTTLLCLLALSDAHAGERVASPRKQPVAAEAERPRPAQADERKKRKEARPASAAKTAPPSACEIAGRDAHDRCMEEAGAREAACLRAYDDAELACEGADASPSNPPKSDRSQGTYRIPYADGTKVHINRDFYDHNPQGKLDMAGRGLGPHRVVAAAPGHVRFIEDSRSKQQHPKRFWRNETECYNNFVWIQHDVGARAEYGEWSKYSHMKQGTTTGAAGLSVGDRVDAGTYLGDQGKVGCAWPAHLHFEVVVPPTDAPVKVADPSGALKGVGMKRRRNPVIEGIEGGVFEDGKNYFASAGGPCKKDNDCDAGFYCNAGVDLSKNQCLPLKEDDATCAAVGGGHQCKSGKCRFSRCYTPDSVKIGGTCYVGDACYEGKCSSAPGTKGTCVCKEDSDCQDGKWCNAGLDLTKNQCLDRKADDETCDVVGGGHQCKSGKCAYGRCYTPRSVPMGGTCYVNAACSAGKCSDVNGLEGECVCKDDSDCRKGKWCDGGLDLKVNACRDKLAKGAKCGKAGSVGNDHKCKSGKCSGFPKYECK